jgi:hypothetical protein
MVWLSLWERFTRQPPPTQLHLIRLTTIKNPPKVVFEPSLISIATPLHLTKKEASTQDGDFSSASDVSY